MPRVIEFRVRHIESRNIRWRDFRQRCAVWDYERVALFASLAPQKLLCLGRALGNPLRGRQRAIFRGNRFLWRGIDRP